MLKIRLLRQAGKIMVRIFKKFLQFKKAGAILKPQKQKGARIPLLKVFEDTHDVTTEFAKLIA